MELLTKELLAPLFPKRKPDDNKYSVGTALAIVGSKYMTGAAVLAAKGALYTGTGLLYLASEKDALPILQAHLLEPVFCESDIGSVKKRLWRTNAVLFGCGVEMSEHNFGLLEYILEMKELPTVLDASALTMLSQRKELYGKLSKNTVLTPHEAEMARLMGETPAYVSQNREKAASEFLERYGCTLVLKGQGTLIASEGRLYRNPTGNTGMAKGGYGDLLSGMILALLSRGVLPEHAAMLGVYLHGLCGDITAQRVGEDSALPSLAAESIGEAIKKLRT